MLISHLNMTHFVFFIPQKSLYFEFGSFKFQILKALILCAIFIGTYDNLGDTLTKITWNGRRWVGGWCPTSSLYWAKTWFYVDITFKYDRFFVF